MGVRRFALLGFLLACFPFGFAWSDVIRSHIDAHIQLLEVDEKPVIIYEAWGNNDLGNSEIVYATAQNGHPTNPNEWIFSIVDDEIGFDSWDYPAELVDVQIREGKVVLGYAPRWYPSFIQLKVATSGIPSSPSDWLSLKAIPDSDSGFESVSLTGNNDRIIVAATDRDCQLLLSEVDINTSTIQPLDELTMSCNNQCAPGHQIDILEIEDTLLIAYTGDVSESPIPMTICVRPQTQLAESFFIEIGSSFPYPPRLVANDNTVGIVWINEKGLQFAWCSYANGEGFDEWYTVKVTSNRVWEYGLCFMGEQPGIVYCDDKGIFLCPAEDSLE